MYSGHEWGCTCVILSFAEISISTTAKIKGRDINYIKCTELALSSISHLCSVDGPDRNPDKVLKAYGSPTGRRAAKTPVNPSVAHAEGENVRENSWDTYLPCHVLVQRHRSALAVEGSWIVLGQHSGKLQVYSKCERLYVDEEHRLVL